MLELRNVEVREAAVCFEVYTNDPRDGAVKNVWLHLDAVGARALDLTKPGCFEVEGDRWYEFLGRVVRHNATFDFDSYQVLPARKDLVEEKGEEKGEEEK